MLFVVSAGDMFWTGQTWTWERTEALTFNDCISADDCRMSLLAPRLADLICVRAYLKSDQ